MTTTIAKFGSTSDARSSLPSRGHLFLVLLLGAFVLIVIAYAVLLSTHHVADSYSARYGVYPKNEANRGRMVTSALFFLYQRLNFYPVNYQTYIIWLILFVLALCSVLFAWRMLETYRRQHTAGWGTVATIGIIAILPFANVFWVDWLSFSDHYIDFTIGILACVLAAVLFGWGSSRWRFVGSALLLGIAVFTYQPTLSIFISLSFALVLADNNFTPTRRLLLQSATVLAIGGSLAFVNVFTIKALQARGILDHDVRDPTPNLETFLGNLPEVGVLMLAGWHNAYGLLPDFLPAIMTILPFALILTGILAKRVEWSQMFLVLAFFVIGNAVAFAPHTITAAVWLTPRSVTGIVGLTSMLFFAVVWLRPIHRSKEIAFALATLYLTVNIANSSRIASTLLAVNRLDEQIASMIYQRILEREGKTGEPIVRVTSVLDDHPTWNYPGVEFAVQGINSRQILFTWADYAIINYVSGRMFTRANVSDEERAELLSERSDWDFFDPDEQIEFRGDTAYIIMY